MKIAAFMLILLLFPACRAQKGSKTPVRPLKTPIKFAEKMISVEFISKNGVFRAQVEVAKTFAKRERGLMFRKKLAADKGMLFVFPRETVNTFWMKNTLIPLDMVFIAKDLRVIGIVHHAKPMDETPVGPDNLSMYVVELPAGTAKNHGIDIGSRVVFQPTVPKALE